MSTGNFYYTNRCVVVSDEDFEDGNLPKLVEWEHSLRSRKSGREVIIDDTLHATKIVLTAGYYSGGCIDYIQDEDKAVDYVINGGEVSTLADECDEENYRKAEALLREEKAKANKIIDKIKADYGYTEVRCIAVASNGEAFYEQL